LKQLLALRADSVCCAFLTNWLNKFFRTFHNVNVFIVVIGVKNRSVCSAFFKWYPLIPIPAWRKRLG